MSYRVNGTPRIVLLVAAVLLFLLAGISAVGWISGVNQAACLAFGLAAYAAATI